jgi:uncharacterized protein (DUF1697 family)
MATYIALLRGVNVGGNTLKMERLRKLCGDLGYQNIRTYVQSGNVLFETDCAGSACVSALENKLIGETRLPVTVIIRTPAELKKVLRNNPFPEAVSKSADNQEPRKPSAPFKLYVAFLAAAPTKDSLRKLDGLNIAEDRFHVAGKEIYLCYANGYGNSKMTNNLFEKLLATRATTRNWNTVTKLYELATN